MSKIRLSMDNCWFTLHFAGSNLRKCFLLKTINDYLFPSFIITIIWNTNAFDAFNTVQTIIAKHLEHSWQKNMLIWAGERLNELACAFISVMSVCVCVREQNKKLAAQYESFTDIDTQPHGWRIMSVSIFMTTYFSVSKLNFH